MSVKRAAARFCAAADDASALDELVKIVDAVPIGGKENSAKQHRAAALDCLKVAQQRLGVAGGDPARLAQACGSLLRLLERSSGSAPPSQLHSARYNVVRRLVSARAFGAALQEALVLYSQLQEHHGGADHARTSLRPPREGEKLSPEEVNLVVGTVLTLALCWSESGAGGEVARILGAAERVEPWMR